MQKEVSPIAVKCPVCDSVENTFVRTAFDDRYGFPESSEIVRCDSCNHFMTLPRLSESDLPSLYGEYYPREYIDSQTLIREADGVASLAARLRRWWEGTNNQGQYSVSPGELMLDIGCGSGLSLLEARAFGAKAVGIEADPNVQRIADELGLQIHMGNLEDAPLSSQLFDLIILNQVIEHIPEPGEILHAVKKFLKPGGRLTITFPNRRSFWCLLFGKKWINWHIPYHQHHFNAKGFARFASHLGYRVVRQKTITPNIWTILQLRALREKAVVGVPTTLWTVRPAPVVSDIEDDIADRSWSLRGVVRDIFHFFVCTSLSIINRLVDVVGYGDSLMIELRIK